MREDNMRGGDDMIYKYIIYREIKEKTKGKSCTQDKK